MLLPKISRPQTVKIMKCNKKKIGLNYNSNTSDDFKKLNEILYAGSQLLKADNDLYISDTDIEKLNERYAVLFKQVSSNPDLPYEQKYNACAILIRKYNFEVNELSKKRKKEYLTEQAKIDADDAEQIPWRRGWWWKLLFQPTTNRAQDIIEEKAELEAAAIFAPMEQELDERADELYAGTGKKLSKRKRQRLMKKYLELRDKLVGDSAPRSDAARDAREQSSETLSEATTAANSVQLQYADFSLAGVSFVPHTASDSSRQSDAEQQEPDVDEPPEPPARKPRKTT